MIPASRTRQQSTGTATKTLQTWLLHQPALSIPEKVGCVQPNPIARAWIVRSRQSRWTARRALSGKETTVQGKSFSLQGRPSESIAVIKTRSGGKDRWVRSWERRRKRKRTKELIKWRWKTLLMITTGYRSHIVSSFLCTETNTRRTGTYTATCMRIRIRGDFAYRCA